MSDLTVIIGASLVTVGMLGFSGVLIARLLRKRTEAYISAYISTFINSFMQSATENPEQFKPAIMAVGNMALAELQKGMSGGPEGSNSGGGSILGGMLPAKYKKFGPLIEMLLPRLIQNGGAQQAAKEVVWG